MAPKVALITGVCGQDGSYLAELLLEKGYIVHGECWWLPLGSAWSGDGPSTATAAASQNRNRPLLTTLCPCCWASCCRPEEAIQLLQPPPSGAHHGEGCVQLARRSFRGNAPALACMLLGGAAALAVASFMPLVAPTVPQALPRQAAVRTAVASSLTTCHLSCCNPLPCPSCPSRRLPQQPELHPPLRRHGGQHKPDKPAQVRGGDGVAYLQPRAQRTCAGQASRQHCAKTCAPHAAAACLSAGPRSQMRSTTWLHRATSRCPSSCPSTQQLPQAW